MPDANDDRAPAQVTQSPDAPDTARDGDPAETADGPEQETQKEKLPDEGRDA